MRERSLYVDVLKGWTIMLVVIGHAVQRTEALGLWPWHTLGGYTVRFLTTGSMPLFIAISGYLSFGRVSKPIRGWLDSKARLLLVPWVSWTLVYYAFVRDPIMRTDMPLSAYLPSQILAPSLWYLVVLFVYYAVLALGLQIGEWSLPLLGATIVLVPLLFPSLAYPYLLFRVQWYFWWFIGGYFLARFQSELVSARWIAWAMAVPVVVFGFRSLGSDAEVASMFVIGLSAAWVSSLISWALMRTVIHRPLAYMGVHSLEIYVGQFLFVGLLIVRSPANAVLTAVLGVVGSLGLGYLLRSNRVTNSLLLGGKRLPTQKLPTDSA